MIGKIPGVESGQEFPNRKTLNEAQVHRPLQAGICGTKKDGAESIVVSGGYKDDQDFGDVIIYTGHGGRDSGTKRQFEDQNLDDSGNAALVTSYLEGQLVRVIRGAHQESTHAPDTGYRYDGLFRVASYGNKRGIDGFLVWQFQLEAVDAFDHGVNPPDIDAPEPAIGPADRRITTSQRIVRNGAIARKVKAWHEDCCQVCGTTLKVPGGAYSEGAHIQALGTPHDGPDVTANILCLCPNCHVLFDVGVITLTDELRVIRDGVDVGALRTVPRHRVETEYVRSHRARWLA